MQAIKNYISYRYGNVATRLITDAYIENYPYTEGCNMALIVPDKFLNSSKIPTGLITDSLNEGNFIRM